MNRYGPKLGWALLLLLSSLPLMLFAYLGSHSRLIIDDYLHLVNGLELGPWQNALNQRNLWNGSYSDYVLHALVAPLGAAAPRVIPVITIALWFVGLVWLVYRVLAFARVKKFQRTTAIALGAAIAAVTINGLLTPRAIYWFAASVRYTLPLAILSLYLALTLEMLTRQGSLRWAAIAGALICFFNAGLSEMYLVVQLMFFIVSLPATYVFLKGPPRRYIIVMFGTGFLASLASMIVQLTSPGVTIRAGHFEEYWGVPDRSLYNLLKKSAAEMLELAIDPEIFAGFILLLALSLFVMLTVYRPTKQSLACGPMRLARSPLLFGLLVQLLCLPLLWNHLSDNPQFLGRFSYGYAIVIGLNLLFLFSLAILIRARSRINNNLERHSVNWTSAPLAALLVVLLLFALTQARSIHWRASIYIYISCHMLLIICCWQLSIPLAKSTGLRFAAGAAFVYGATWLTIAAVSTLVFFNYVRVFPRVLSFASYSLALHGLVWGLYLGYAIQHFKGAPPDGRNGSKLLSGICLIAALLIGAGIFIGHAKLAPSFAQYSSEWDARHQRIIDLRDAGARTVSVRPLSFDLARYMRLPEIHEQSLAPKFYKVDAIVLEGA